MERWHVFFLGLAVMLVVGIGIQQLGTRHINQPLEFNHKKHSVELEMDCVSCHEYAEDYNVAGIPSIQVCVMCHEEGLIDENPKNEEIEKLQGYIKQGEEIRWVRMYVAPDHVFFSHRRHVRGGVECGECHGSTGRSRRPVVEEDLISMKRCVSCHEERNVDNDCLTCHK